MSNLKKNDNKFETIENKIRQCSIVKFLEEEDEKNSDFAYDISRPNGSLLKIQRRHKCWI
jgi:hypothetical protein